MSEPLAIHLAPPSAPRRVGAVATALLAGLVVAACGAWAGGAREAGRSAAAAAAAVVALAAALSLPGGLPRMSRAEKVLALAGLLAAVQLIPWPEPLARLLAPAAARAREASLGHSGASPVSHDLGATARAGLLLLGLPLLAQALRGVGAAGAAWALARVLALVLAGHAAVALWRGDYGEDDRLLGGAEVGNALNAWGTFVNRAHFAGFAVVCLGPALALLKGPRPWLDRPLGLLAVFTAVPAVFESGSRAGMLGVAVCLAVGLVVALPARIRWWTLGLIVLLGALGAGLFLSSSRNGIRKEAIERALAAKPGEGKRLEIWKGSLDLAAEQPVLGSGIDAFRWAYAGGGRPVPDRWVSTAESDVLQAAAEGGVALLAVLGAAAVFGLRALRRARRASSPAGRASSALAVCGLVGSVPVALTNAPYHVPAVVLAAVASWAVARALAGDSTPAPGAGAGVTPAILARVEGGRA